MKCMEYIYTHSVLSGGDCFTLVWESNHKLSLDRDTIPNTNTPEETMLHSVYFIWVITCQKTILALLTMVRKE